MRQDISDTILKILEEGPKTPHELHNQTKKRMVERGVSFTEPTYYRHLATLQKRGEICRTEKPKYWLVGREKEADPQVVNNLIKKLEKETNEDVLEITSKDLADLCNYQRVAHIPNALNFIKSSLQKQKFQQPKILMNLIRCLYYMLCFEKNRKSPSIFTERISSNIERVGNIVESSLSPEILQEAFTFLTEIGDKKATDLILIQTKRLPEEQYQRLKTHIVNLLFRKQYPLYKKHRILIDNRIIDMIKNPNAEISKRGKELNTEKQIPPMRP